MQPQVVVVGSFVQDLTWQCPEFPRPGQTVVGRFTTGPGGKGSNQAVACARAGVRTLFIGAAGPDSFAAAARAFYKAEGIACRLVEKRGRATGTAGILVNAGGQNEIVVALGANAALARADVPVALLRSTRVVVAQLESNLATTAHVLQTARRAGVTTVLNPAPMRPEFEPAMLAYADILIPNETEFVALVNLLPATGRRNFTEAALHALAPGALHALCRTFAVPAVIVTLGGKGCFVSQSGGHTVIPACTGLKVVDTTGAGDAYVGGFAAGLVKFEGDLVRAAQFGNTVAALSVTKFGTAPSMPVSRTIARFLRSRARG